MVWVLLAIFFLGKLDATKLELVVKPVFDKLELAKLELVKPELAKFELTKFELCRFELVKF